MVRHRTNPLSECKKRNMNMGVKLAQKTRKGVCLKLQAGRGGGSIQGQGNRFQLGGQGGNGTERNPEFREKLPGGRALPIGHIYPLWKKGGGKRVPTKTFWRRKKCKGIMAKKLLRTNPHPSDGWVGGGRRCLLSSLLFQFTRKRKSMEKKGGKRAN